MHVYDNDTHKQSIGDASGTHILKHVTAKWWML